jgi:hypothetical protein
MGTRVAILAVGDGDFAGSLRRIPRADPERTGTLLARAYPGYQVEPEEGWPLDESVYPDEADLVYALSAPGISLVCDQRFLTCTPSQLPAHLLEMAGGRRTALCSMHSVDDSFAYAVWENGVLVRSLGVSVSVENLVVEDIGEPRVRREDSPRPQRKAPAQSPRRRTSRRRSHSQAGDVGSGHGECHPQGGDDHYLLRLA